MKKGFTLIELSIVLVIIGLIVGGVLVGQEMIEAGKIRKEISYMQQLETAMNAYRMKYNAMPGDHSNATSMGLGGGNGNGDKLVGWPTEAAYFWDHLRGAGYYNHSEALGGFYDVGINNTYVYPYSCTLYTTYGTNRPASSLCLNFATLEGAALTGGAYTVNQAWSIDTKIDNGAPYDGQFLSTYHTSVGASESCASDLNGANNTYRLSLDDSPGNAACRSIYVIWKR